MSKYFPGFNSINWQKMELILNEKHCTWLGNIFAYPGGKGIGEGLGEIWEAMDQRKLGFLCNCRGQGFRDSNSEGRVLVGKSRENAPGARLGWEETMVWGDRHCHKTIFMYPRSKENPITSKEKDGSQIPRKKNRGAKTRVSQTYPP